MTATTIQERTQPVVNSAMRPVGSFAVKSRGSIDPSRYPDEIFELFSIPAYDSRMPEVLRGSKIGSAKKVVIPGDVLISRIVPHIQRVWVVGPSSGHRQIASGEWIVFGHSEIEPDYLRHMLLSKPFHDQFMQTVAGMGGSLMRARPSEVERIEIPVPPSRTEQRRIATILDKADAIRHKREQALTLADDLLRSEFLEMFGDPVENEREWPLSPLGDLGDVQGGLQVTSKRVSMGMTLPYLRVANVYRDRLNLDEIKEINLSEAEFKRVRLEVGDILIVEGHGNPDEIGRAAIWDGSIEPCVHQNHLIRFRADRKRALPDFISRFLNSDGGRRQLIGAGRTTSGLNTISTRKVKEVSVPLPPVALQDQFAHVVRKQVALTNRLLAQKVMANNLFAALSQRAFAGDL